jgi:hypothetical protein
VDAQGGRVARHQVDIGRIAIRRLVQQGHDPLVCIDNARAHGPFHRLFIPAGSTEVAFHASDEVRIPESGRTSTAAAVDSGCGTESADVPHPNRSRGRRCHGQAERAPRVDPGSDNRSSVREACSIDACPCHPTADPWTRPPPAMWILPPPAPWDLSPPFRCAQGWGSGPTSPHVRAGLSCERLPPSEPGCPQPGLPAGNMGQSSPRAADRLEDKAALTWRNAVPAFAPVWEDTFRAASVRKRCRFAAGNRSLKGCGHVQWQQRVCWSTR